jgi:diguanylate cyclase (GGDEF)-like protein
MTTNRRILLIDDTPSIHEDFRRILSPTDATTELDAAEEALFGAVEQSNASVGFEIDSAHQGQEGLALLRASLDADRPYALAFVDMRMPPGWDGLETIQELWNVDPRLHIVICTAHSDYSWDEVLAKLGVEDRLIILKKPFDHIEVAQLANALSARWDMTRQAELQVHQLEAAGHERTKALEIAHQELASLIIQVTHDALTGLPNRVLFADRVSQALAASGRDGTCPVVLMLDLDRFKEVNDTLGHPQGDLLLQQVSERLRGLLRTNDTVARLGGDEFALLLTDGGSDTGTEIAVRICSAIAAPFQLGDDTVCVKASIGIATVVAGDEHSTLDELLRQADNAMYKAKADGSGFAHYSAPTTPA